MAVMKAVKRFKTRVGERRGVLIDGILGRESRFSRPPHSIHNQTKSQNTDDRRPWDRMLATSGIHRDVEVNDKMQAVPPDMERLTIYASPDAEDDNDFEKRIGETQAHYKQRVETLRHHPDALTRSSTLGSEDIRTPGDSTTTQRSRTFPVERTLPVDGHLKGHAHDPLEDTLFLRIGHDPSLYATTDDAFPMFSESPPPVEMNIYDAAYQEEMERILARRPREPSIYLTRRIEHRDDIRSLSNIKDAGKYAARQAAARLERVSTRAAAQGRPVATYARSASDKVSEGWASGSAAAAPYIQSGKEYLEPWRQSGKEALEPWKQSARSAVSQGLDKAGRAQEKLGQWYNKEGGTGERFSGLVAKAQAKARGVSPRPVAVDADASTTPAPAAGAAAEQDGKALDGGEEESQAASAAPSDEADEKSRQGLLIASSGFREHI